MLFVIFVRKVDILRQYVKNVSKSSSGKPKLSTINRTSLAGTSASINHRTLKALSNVKINGLKAKALMATGSCDCYINHSSAEKLSLVIQNFAGEVTLAETSVRMPVFGQCFVNLYVEGNEYNNVAFNVLNNLSTDVIIGEKIFQEHKKVIFNFDGSRLPLMLNASCPKWLFLIHVCLVI